MGRWDKEIAKAKADLKPNRGTVKVEHEKGFILMDVDAFMSLPKTKQTKILKLGGN
ncbi:hypothetical protein [Anaerotignum sp.]|uniref:hypothetical protein n=1 Tax=Anaerotignum sp. TaxID=2039241 RepID=UPI0033197E13